MRVLAERPVGPPGGQRPGRLPVSIVRPVAGFGARQVEPDDVRRMPLQETLVLIRSDHVIRWRDDEAEVRNGRTVIAKGTERADLGHGTSRNGASPRALGRVHRTIAPVRPPQTVQLSTRVGRPPSDQNHPDHRGVLVLRHPPTPRISPGARRGARIVALIAVVLGALGPAALPAAAADSPSMEARVLLAGHARIGSWVAISIHLTNDGPPVTGELRLAGGSQGQTRFGTPVDLPTQADKTYVIYAQPPTFGSELKVDLIDGAESIVSTKAKFTAHDASQLVVAVIAEHPERIIGSIDLPPNISQVAPLLLTLTPEDLPERVEAWTSIDRIVWQDTEADRLSPTQLAAMRGWLAGGGRLVVAGGTVGPAALAAFPDAMLPYRPVVTTDVPAASLTGLLGELPTGATALPALSGDLIAGRTLATVGDRVVAAERPYGSGSVTLLGFDPGVDWIAKTDAAQDLWRRLLPTRTFGGLAFGDDNLLVSAVSQSAGPVAPADRWSDPHPARLHPADRTDQLLRPAPTRPSRVGVVHDARSDRRVRGRGIRVRRRPARQRAGGQRGRRRPRGTRHDRWDRAGLPRPVLADARRLPGQRAGWGAPVRADHRRLRDDRDRQQPRRPAGRSLTDPRPGRGVLVPACGPGRDRGRRCH